MADKITVIIENYQDGNAMFPGWAKKFKELWDVPANTTGENAIVLDVDNDDQFEELRRDLNNQGVGCIRKDDVPDEKKGFFAKIFGIVKSEDKEKSLAEQWKEVYAQLPKGTKDPFKNVKPDNLSDVELTEKIAEAKKVIEESNEG